MAFLERWLASGILQETIRGDGAMKELPRYKCHKEVRALKIAKIEPGLTAANEETDGSMVITPAEPGYEPFEVDWAYVRKHDPRPGGYYVVYDDGYKSWSPADAFEAGYTRI